MAAKILTLEERMDADEPLGVVNGRVVTATEDYDDEEGLSVQDAAPRTLYVRRDLLNAEEVVQFYADQLGQNASVLSDPDKLHVTIAYSRKPVDWIKAGEAWDQDSRTGELHLAPGGARLHERLGKDGAKDALVLQFTSSSLSSRWYCLHDVNEGSPYPSNDVGCSWDFPDYQPHVTIAWDKDQVVDEKLLQPWRGPLVFGPEIFEEVDEDWKAKAGVDE